MGLLPGPSPPPQIWHPLRRNICSSCQNWRRRGEGEEEKEKKKEKKHHWIKIQRSDCDSSEIKDGTSHPKICFSSWLPASHTADFKGLITMLRDCRGFPSPSQDGFIPTHSYPSHRAKEKFEEEWAKSFISCISLTASHQRHLLLFPITVHLKWGRESRKEGARVQATAAATKINRFIPTYVYLKQH